MPFYTKTNKPIKNYQKKKYYTNRSKWSKNISKSPYQKKIIVPTYSNQPKEIYYYNPQTREWKERVN